MGECMEDRILRKVYSNEVFIGSIKLAQIFDVSEEDVLLAIKNIIDEDQRYLIRQVGYEEGQYKVFPRIGMKGEITAFLHQGGFTLQNELMKNHAIQEVEKTLADEERARVAHEKTLSDYRLRFLPHYMAGAVFIFNLWTYFNPYENELTQMRLKRVETKLDSIQNAYSLLVPSLKLVPTSKLVDSSSNKYKVNK